MNHQEMLNVAQEEVRVRALRIKSMWSEDAVNCEYDKAFGFILALNSMEIFDGEQFDAAINVLSVARREAAQKSRPGVGSTESGSKECRPVRDDNYNFSVEEKPQNVKPRPKAYVHAEIFPVANLQMKIFGSASELLAILTCLISNLRDAGVPEIELLSTYIINNKRRANAIREKGESDAE